MTASDPGYVTRHVVVTQEHIDKGVPRSCWKCPIARALGAGGVTVMRDIISVWDDLPDDQYHEDDIQTPDEVREFIDRFDNEKPVQPFEFDIDWPVWA